MNLFKCDSCGQLAYFENRVCGQCGHRLGFLPELSTLSALEPDGADANGQSWPNGQTWAALADQRRRWRFCANAGHDACNWLVREESAEAFCTACRHNRVIPDLAEGDNLAHWQRLEIAKHRLFYTLMKLGLPLANHVDDQQHGLVFEFKADPAYGNGPRILTGHDEGLIVLNLAEADDAERERRRVAMGEPFRTLLGHFRHEIGHYYWDVLVRDGGRIEGFRAAFGDESADYEAALRTHYANGAPPDWQERFVSAYASAHPWEDFAETWAHYLHIVDTIETASSFGLGVHPRIDASKEVNADLDFDPHRARDIAQLIDAWLPLTFAMNSLSRSMGTLDIYPFILSPLVIDKLGYVHDLVHAQGDQQRNDAVN